MQKRANKAEPTGCSKTQSPIAEGGIAVLRSETALSRFPLHKLSQDDIKIQIGDHPKAILWRVSGNSDYGEPGHLAYKIDTLHINRRIEETGRPIPKIIRLGSLREIGEGIGCNSTPELKRALLQNATASITAKISYKTQESGEKSLEAVFNRYSVVFTNEMLPDGYRADAVYIVLNDIYQEVLNSAVFRPLDYDYMGTLAPMAQRLYEIVSYQIFSAVKNNNTRAKISYSEYCMLSTATRYFDFDHVKKQMYKVFRPHTTSGYIARIEYERTRDEQGREDWWMWLTPGPGAGREFLAFSGQGKTRKPTTGQVASAKRAKPKAKATPAVDSPGTAPAQLEISGAFAEPETPFALASVTGVTSSANCDESALERDLERKLIEAQLNRADAQRFARDVPDVCRRQLAFLPFVGKFKTSQGAYLRRAIEGDFGPPAGYVAQEEKQAQQQATRSRRAQELFAANEQKAREGHQGRFYGLYIAFLQRSLTGLETERPEAFMAFVQAEGEQRQNLTSGPFADRPLTRAALEAFDAQENRLERARLFLRKQGVHLPDFWEWDSEFNAAPFRF